MNREDFFVTPALAEITSPDTLVSEKAPWRLLRSVAVSGLSEQLLMLYILNSRWQKISWDSQGG
jgi:hypothetical protein